MSVSPSQYVISILASLGVFLQLVPACAAEFTDVPAQHPHADAIQALQETGVLQGYDDGTFKPNETINRAEFLKIILEARGNVPSGGSNCFPDVHQEWFAQYVCAAKAEGIIGGYPDNTFKPEQDVSFVEAGKILTLAYKQQTQGGSEWYEPYARALEASYAIPTSINALEEKLTRGEMAEMMWRLKEGITDRPSKGYLNVKYPAITVNLASDDVQRAASCADLQAFAQEAQSTGTDIYYRTTTAAPNAAQAEGAAASDADYSSTNVQVAGVDEGDVIKTDGNYVYAIADGAVHIVQAVPPTDMKDVATLQFASEGFSPSSLYIDGGKLVVIGSVYDPRTGAYTDGIREPGFLPYVRATQSQVRIYDLQTITKPSLLRTVTVDGVTLSTRRINGLLYLIMNHTPHYWGTPQPYADVSASSVLPGYSDTAHNIQKQPVTDCTAVHILPHVPQPQYLMVGIIPLHDTNKPVSTEVIVGSAETVYASLNNIYVAARSWNYEWNAQQGKSWQETHIYRFAYQGDSVELAAEGTVNGHVLNQFSMDEHQNTFRIATTIAGEWRADGTQTRSSNALFVLNNDLQTLGSILDIAPGETIRSVRFMGDRAYMVTFKQVDPLFVIDTSNHRNPAILGQLKIPGYSDYLHPYDETHLIGFGKEVDETIDADKIHSDGSVYYTAVLGMKVSLFDVSNVSKPTEMHKIIIGDRGTTSPLLNDHKALLFDASRNLLSFPISVMELPAGAKPSDTSAYPTQTFQGAHVYSLSLDKGFSKLGDITHYSSDDQLKSGSTLWGKDIYRILRIGDTLYTASRAGIQSTALKTLQTQDFVPYAHTLVNDVVYPPVPSR